MGYSLSSIPITVLIIIFKKEEKNYLYGFRNLTLQEGGSG